MSFSKSFKKDNVKNIAKSESKSDFNYDTNHKFYDFYKGYDEFEEISRDSKYNKMNKFTNLLTKFKNLKPKITTQKGVNYEKCWWALRKVSECFKNDYDADELSEAKKKQFSYRQFELFDKTEKKSKLDRETKKDESKLTALPKWC